jgi:hypothetical protein
LTSGDNVSDEVENIGSEIRNTKVALVGNCIGTLFALIGVGSLVFLILLSTRAFGQISDLPEYYAPAKLVLDGHGASAFTLAGLGDAQHRLFPSMGSRIVPLFVPPLGLTLLSPIALIPETAIAYVWKLVLVLSLVASICLLRKSFELNYKQTCYLIAAISLSDACYEALRIDQLAPILLLSYAATIYCLQRNYDIPAGLWLCLIILKPQQFLPFLAYLAGTKRVRPLIVCGIGFLLLTVVAYFQIGQNGFANYTTLVSSPSSIQYMQPELTPTLRGQLLKLFPSAASTIFSITSVAYFASIAFSFCWGLRYSRHPKSLLIGVLTVMPLALVSSLHCHNYDLLLLIPSILVIFSDVVVLFGSPIKLAVIFGGITFMLPLAIIIHYDYLLKGGQFNPWFFQLMILAISLIVLVSRNKALGARQSERS